MARPRRPADTRPALLSVVALMFLLLPMLLLTSGASKLAGIDLRLLAGTGELPPPPPGPVESLEIAILPDRGEGHPLRIRAGLRRADLGAGTGDVRVREERLPPAGGAADLAGLQSYLRGLKALDPSRRRALIAPADGVPTAAVVRLMDAVRADREGPLYPELLLSTEAAP